MMITQPQALEAINICKHFGPLVALDNVSLRLAAGSFHALLGENGAGKSTLVKCIMGYYQPDEGQLLLAGREEIIGNPQDAHDLGVGMVYQHFTLIPNMTVAENLVLARSHLPAIIHWRDELKQLKEKMENMPFQVPLDANINSLAAGEKQKVEIIKQLMLDSKILILDEPTSVLTPNEADDVLGKIKAMTRDSGLSVLIITHKFREVMSFADEVTVLRKGKFVGTTKVAEANPQSMATMMVGEEVQYKPLERLDHAAQATCVEVNRLMVDNDAGQVAVMDLSLSIAAGEIVGIAGVSGNGQRELLEALSGQRVVESGEIRVHGEGYSASRADIRKHKVRSVPEEPLRNACVQEMSVAENLAFRRFDQVPFSRFGWLIDRRAMRKSAKERIRLFSVRPPMEDNFIGNLSGGNVQRAVLARELSDEVSFLIVANPCFGLDFGAAAEIRARIMAARNEGAAVLLVSEDLDEVLELSDRLMVISGGKLVYETTPAAADRTAIGQYMAGH